MPELLSRRYPAEAESVPAVRHAVGDALTAAGFTDGDVRFSIALAVTEATANAVRHAYPHDAQGQIEVRVDYTASHGVVITITDHGVGMDARIGPPRHGPRAVSDAHANHPSRDRVQQQRYHHHASLSHQIAARTARQTPPAVPSNTQRFVFCEDDRQIALAIVIRGLPPGY